jgi:anti-sigma B factor antagonist
MELQITDNVPVEQYAVLTAGGRLDTTTAPDLKAAIKRLVKDGCLHVIVDLDGVSFIDSSGLAALVSGLKAVRDAGGTLKLTGLSDQVRTVFGVTLLDRVFEFYPDVASAVDALSD